MAASLLVTSAMWSTPL